MDCGLAIIAIAHRKKTRKISQPLGASRIPAISNPQREQEEGDAQHGFALGNPRYRFDIGT